MKVLRTALAAALCVVVMGAIEAGAQIDTAILPPVGYHPSNITYFNTPYLANALAHGGEWFSFTTAEFGTPVDFNALPTQFINGYPQFLESGQKLRGAVFGLNINDPHRPDAWPSRSTLTKGRVDVTWTGNADIRLHDCDFVSTGSTPATPTGLAAVGRRIYDCSGENQTHSIEIHAMQAPITDLKVWLPAVDDPLTLPKENELTTLEGQMFHPLFLDRIADADWGFIRFMDWGMTNASPQMNWSDRRIPDHIFQTGIINDRSPTFPDSELSQGDRETGIAWEHMVALCNLTQRDMWINIPHLADATYIENLAKLIRFGSDGVNPYSAANPNAEFPPLDSNLKVYIEYSNEIWSSGGAFPQGNWAQERAPEAGFTNDFAGRARFNARKFADTFKTFQDVFGGTTRLVRVAAIFTANNTYTGAFLDEMASYGVGLTPQVRPDVLAVTTYFGNGIQNFVHEEGFTTGLLFDDPYWTSEEFEADLATAFLEWKRRILSGDASTGSGPDATSLGGGFSSGLADLVQTELGYELPIIAYEGGPSLFTDEIDEDAENEFEVPTDDGVTIFIEAMNRDERIADVYRIHLDLAKSKGLWTHTPYVDTSIWSRFGQWGHLETLDQDPAESPKYSLMLEHFTTFSTLNHIDEPVGNAPSFTSADILDPGIVGQAYDVDILTTGGDGARTITVIGSFLDPGLSITGPSAGTLTVSGTPTISQKNFIFARVTDADGDPAWRIFTLETFGGPGTLIQSDFRGTDPGLNLPWDDTFVLSPKVTWTGWDVSEDTGLVPAAGDDAIVFSTSAATENEPLVMTENQFLTATVTPVAGPIDLREAEFRFSIRRIGFHAPRRYAVFCEISGFSEVNALYVSTSDETDGETQHVLTFPNTGAYSAVNVPFELRIYAFGGSFDGHQTSLTGFKLTEKVGPLGIPANLQATATSTSSVSLSWTAVDTATSYEIFRRFNAVAEESIGIVTGTSHTDLGRLPSTAHVYRVRALRGAEVSGFSNPDLATTILFTDDPIAAGSTKIKRTHIVEMRTAVNAVRATAGLSATTFTDSTITAGSTKARAVHITDLRTALTPALTALSIPVPSFTAISIGTVITGAHVQQIRTPVK